MILLTLWTLTLIAMLICPSTTVEEDEDKNPAEKNSKWAKTAPDKSRTGQKLQWTNGPNAWNFFKSAENMKQAGKILPFSSRCWNGMTSRDSVILEKFHSCLFFFFDAKPQAFTCIDKIGNINKCKNF